METPSFISPDALEDTAVLIQMEDVIRQFTEEELSEQKEFLADLNVELRKLDDISDTIKETLKGDGVDHIDIIAQMLPKLKKSTMELGTKSIKKLIVSVTNLIKKGYKEEHGKVHYLPDYDNSKMHRYDSYGNYVGSRPMRPEERQTSIYSLSKAN